MLNWLKGKSKKQYLSEWTQSSPLPIGRAQFEEWANIIIEASMVEADHSSLKYALSNMIMQLEPLEDHKPLAYFIKALRKVASNETANAIRNEIFEARKAITEPKTEPAK